MKKPTYKYPDFVSKVELKSEYGKRYWLNLEIDQENIRTLKEFCGKVKK